MSSLLVWEYRGWHPPTAQAHLTLCKYFKWPWRCELRSLELQGLSGKETEGMLGREGGNRNGSLNVHLTLGSSVQVWTWSPAWPADGPSSWNRVAVLLHPLCPTGSPSRGLHAISQVGLDPPSGWLFPSCYSSLPPVTDVMCTRRALNSPPCKAQHSPFIIHLEDSIPNLLIYHYVPY